MEDGRTPKSASIRFTRFNNLSAYPVLAEEGVEVEGVNGAGVFLGVFESGVTEKCGNGFNVGSDYNYLQCRRRRV